MAAIESPCINVCALDTASGLCRGCGRTGEEIGAWTAMTADGRRALMSALPARLAALQARAHAGGGTG